MVRACISLTEAQERDLDIVSENLDRSNSWVVRRAVDEYLNRLKNEQNEKPELETA